MTKPHRVPPSPGVMATLFMEYRRSGKMAKMSFKEFLKSIGFTDPAADIVGMDDAARFRMGPGGPELIEMPDFPVRGKLDVKVLLVDFGDRPGTVPPQHYEDMLFSENGYPTGSMTDFYSEVSLGKVQVAGSVHGWFRMPHSYSYYTHGKSGFAAYPKNAQRLAEDAVNAAVAQGVKFDKQLDKLDQGVITALFIVHAGQGAEELHPSLQNDEIWSHKWNLKHPVRVAPDLAASIYLTVPHDCKVGVCAHELGHLAFQWQDFYDPNYAEDGHEWDGAGVWDLMAGGSWNGGGAHPAHPAGLHKIQHGWVPVTTVTKSTRLTVRPYSGKSGRIYKIVSPSYRATQYLLLENRSRRGFDFHLPGEGLLVWRVDEQMEMEAPDRPGMLLIQADGKHQLETPRDWNEGDGGDPFPGKARRKKLDQTGTICTSFPHCKRSGVRLENISIDRRGNITLDVKFVNTKSAAGKRLTKGARVVTRKAKATTKRGRAR